jgi:hypothetical protein
MSFLSKLDLRRGLPPALERTKVATAPAPVPDVHIDLRQPFRRPESAAPVLGIAASAFIELGVTTQSLPVAPASAPTVDASIPVPIPEPPPVASD